MAAPIGHIYLALRLLAGPLQGVDEQAFLIGTSFPDIRYWINAPRTYTHKPNVTIKEIFEEPDAFNAGMLFHSFVDDARGDFFKKNKLPWIIQQVDLNGYLIKTIEDAILFQKFTDKSFTRYFDTILAQERKLISDEDLIKKWHAALQEYFSKGPTQTTLRNLFLNSIDPLKKLGTQIFYQLSKDLAASVTLKNKILSFYDNFEAIVGLAPQNQSATLVRYAGI